MTDSIEPALSAEEWRECVSISRGGGDPLTYSILADPQKAMAWINGNLDDTDPRKITRAGISALASIVARARADAARVGPLHAMWDWIFDAERQIAALRNLLPPE